MPRPCVAAMRYEPLGDSERSLTAAFGRPVPRRDQALGVAADATNMPTSIARYRFVPAITRSSAGASGRPPEMSVQVTPPSFDSNTWPTPEFGIQRREKPPNTAYTCAAFAGSTVI